jgi:hypothetical protein
MDLTDLKNWPDGAEVYTDGSFKKWIDAKEFILSNGEWFEATESWDIVMYESAGCKVTMRPQDPDKWKEGEERMNVVQQNGNDGEHYEELEANKNKYQREVKEGVFVDVYDVLKAFNVVNPAMSHAIKKMLAPGQRGAKDVIQDMKEAIQSIERAIELEK